MPGVNCSVLGCGSCRRSKGLGIFKLPAAKDEVHRKWRNEWLGEVPKAREIDEDFREQIKNDKVHVCEKHFKPEDIEICKYRFISVELYSMWPLDRTAPGPDALYSSRHFLAESELKSENSLWKDSTIFLHSFFRLVSFMWL